MEISKTMLGVLTLGYLRRHCQSRAAARTQEKIAGDLADLGIEATARDVRDAVARLVEQGAPIGTSAGKPAGCFLCVERADFEAGYHNLVVRVRAQAARSRRFARTAREALSGQAAFDFDEADDAFYELQAAPVLLAAGNGGRRHE